MPKKLITIGGGNAKTMLHIDKTIVHLTKKKKPTILFIPTASSDDLNYVEWMKKQYVEKLGCQMKTLLLLEKEYSQKEIKALIAEADIIYVGGGNTLMMMKKWRRLGVDKLLKKAWNDGKVLCGVSAGSICWFESGHSDSMHFYNSQKWDYIRVRGLDFLPFIHCPHYDSETADKKRKDDFKRMLKKYPKQVGIACDDGVAIAWIDDKFKVLSESKKANAYRVYWENGKFYEEKLENRDKFLPINSLHLR